MGVERVNMKVLYIYVLLLISLSIKAEETTDRFIYIYSTYSIQQPDKDMSTRFGISSDFGGSIGFKTDKNWLFGIESTYIFGNNVRENTLENITNSHNQITNMYGGISEIIVRESGVQIKSYIGKIIPVLKKNKNSGIFIKANVGFLQHKIYIENKENNTPQIMGDYKKGYDRLSNGMMISEFIGWQNFSNKGAYNFLIGFEFIQAKTQVRRTWDYATNKKIDNSQLDLLYTLKVAWYITFHKHKATEYFYY
jgi:hypothetical protein